MNLKWGNTIASFLQREEKWTLIYESLSNSLRGATWCCKWKVPSVDMERLALSLLNQSSLRISLQKNSIYLVVPTTHCCCIIIAFEKVSFPLRCLAQLVLAGSRQGESEEQPSWPYLSVHSCHNNFLARKRSILVAQKRKPSWCCGDFGCCLGIWVFSTVLRFFLLLPALGIFCAFSVIS